jgi:hypothetical protein
MAVNDIKVPKENAEGTFNEVALAPADIGAVATSDSRLTDARTPLSHTHGNLTNAGAIGTTSGLPLKTGTSGVIEAGAFGASAGQFAEGNHTHEADDINGLSGAAAGGLYDGALSIVGASVSDANLRLINGDANEVVLAYENITATRFITLPDASGTIALNETFASPPAIGNTTPSTGAFTTLTATTSLTLGTSGILSGGTNTVEQRNTT